MQNNTRHNGMQFNRGFTLLEVLVYLVIFAVVSLVLINGIIISMKSFAATRENRIFARTGADVMERVAREIRSATSIEPLNTTFDSNPGALGVHVIDSDDNDVLVEFEIVDDELQLSYDGVSVGILTNDEIDVSSFVVRELTAEQGVGVKIEITLQSVSTGREESFATSVSLRGSW